MSTTEVRKRLLAALLVVKRDGPKDHDQGICTAVASALGNKSFIDDVEVDELLEEVMAKWPKTSGSINFPIPGVNGNSYVATYIDFRTSNKNMWDPETEYGALRLELLDHCIAQLQKELSDVQASN